MKKLTQKTLISVFLFFFAFGSSARAEKSLVDFNPGDVKAVLFFAIQNISIFTPQVPEFSATPMQVESTQEAIFQILMEEKIQGYDAFFFLWSILESDPSAPSHFKDRISAHLKEYQMDSMDEETIFNLLNGKPQTRTLSKSVSHQRTFGPGEGFGKALEIVQLLPDFFPGKERLLNAVLFAKEMVVGSFVNDCYNDDPGCVHGANFGLISYIGKQLEGDQKLYVDSLRFYVRLKKYDKLHRYEEAQFTIFAGEHQESLWPMVLDATGGDPYQALRVVSIYTHDQCCTGIGTKKSELISFFDLLNYVSPTVDHGDYAESSIHAPGALPGITPSKKFIDRYQELQDRYFELTGSRPDFHLNNYHFYGGVFTANEFIRNGFANIDGVKFAIFASQALGFFYKKFTMPMWMKDDVLYYWTELMHEDQTAKPEKPADWDQRRFDLAQVEMELFLFRLDWTAEQHRLGAKFAYKTFLNAYSNDKNIDMEFEKEELAAQK